MIEIYGKHACAFCEKAKWLCESQGLEYTYRTLDKDYTQQEFFEMFPTARTFPQIVANGQLIGGYEAFEKSLKD